MNTLNRLLSSIDFTKDQQNGIAMMLIEKQCFRDDDRFNKLSLTRQDIDYLLHFEFDISITDLMQLLVDLTQKYMLGTFDVTSTNNNRYEEMEYQQLDLPRRMMVDLIGFNQEVNWSKELGPIEHVYVHGATELSLRARIKHMIKNIKLFGGDKINIYYGTNPRGVFPFESSIVPILYENLSKVNDNIKILDIERAIKELNTKKINWTTKPDGVTQSINTVMKYCGDITWPKFHINPDYNPEYYDLNSSLEGIESVAGKWPTSMELFEHILKLECEFQDFDFSGLNIIPDLGRGYVKDGKYYIANTVILLKEFSLRYNIKSKIMVVTDNSVSFAAARQKYETHKAFQDKMDSYVVYDSVDDSRTNFDLICQQVAKTFYSINTSM
jgi:hypothetical protein